MPRAALILAAWLLALPAGASEPARTALDAVMASQQVDIVHAAAFPDGTVEVLFGIDASEREQEQIVEALRAHPDVRAVVATTSPRGVFCRSIED